VVDRRARREALLALGVEGEVDHEDRVLLHDADEQDDPDDRDDPQVLAEEHERVAALRDRLEAGILSRVPRVVVNGDRAHRVPTTTNLTFDYIEGEGFVIAMDLRGIACATGSACSSGSREPSHVLSAIGLKPEQARASIRFSLGRFSTDQDVDTALEILPAVVEQLRAVAILLKPFMPRTAETIYRSFNFVQPWEEVRHEDGWVHPGQRDDLRVLAPLEDGKVKPLFPRIR